MYVCVCVCVCMVCVCVCVCVVCVCVVCVCICMVCVCICMVCVCVCVCICMVCVCVCVCVRVRVYGVCMYVCMYGVWCVYVYVWCDIMSFSRAWGSCCVQVQMMDRWFRSFSFSFINVMGLLVGGCYVLFLLFVLLV